MFENQQHYLAFGAIGTGIEFLGACLDEKGFHDRNAESRVRFESAMKKFDPKYHDYASLENDFDLYKNLRCGMSHVVRPQGKIDFVSLDEANSKGFTHLQEASSGLLILVIEQFYLDFADASKVVRAELKSGNLEKSATDSFLATP